MCPDGLVLDGSGGCIPKDQCPCVHGGHFYKPGETIKVDCNTWYVIHGSLVLQQFVRIQSIAHSWGRVCFKAFLFIMRAIGLLVKVKGEVFLCIMLHEPALGENKHQYLLSNDFHPFLFPHQLQKHQPYPDWCVVAHSIRGHWHNCVCWGQLNPGKWLNLVKEELQWSSLDTCSASRCVVLKIN